MSTPPSATADRLDKWLWAMRVFKTRALATDACRAGSVAVNDLVAKPARTVQTGETVSVRQGLFTRTLRVVGVPRSRVGAKLLQTYCTDLTPPEEYEQLAARAQRAAGARPRKGQRPTHQTRPPPARFFARMNVFSKFETELAVRPDDIDLYQHVHSTRYLDYVLAARFEQMEKHYGMSMQAFAERGLGWWMTSAHIDYKRPLGWGDRMTVRCWIVHFTENGCRVAFEIDKRPAGKRVCEGHTDYVLVTLSTGRATALPQDVRAKYSI